MTSYFREKCKVLFTPQSLLLSYVALLFLVPNDVFASTALWSYETPAFITYKWNSFYFSVLYVPIIIAAINCYVKREKFPSRVFLFIAALFFKDIILAAMGHTYMFDNRSFEWYMQFVVSACFLVVVFHLDRGLCKPYLFLYIIFGITLLTLTMGVLLHVTPGQYDYVNRYTSTNMSHGETAFLLAVCAMFFLGRMEQRWSPLLFAVAVLMIVPTGTRKDFLYVALIFAVYILERIFNGVSRYRKSQTKKKYTYTQILIYLTAIFVAICGVGLFSDSLVRSLNLDRFVNLFDSLFGGGSQSILSDNSTEGRMLSLESGLSILKANWLLGLDFSFYDLQFNMQLNGFPTFPHFSWLLNWLLMGLLVFVPIAMLLRATFVLYLHRDPLRYCSFYMILYFAISGAAWSSFKIVVFTLYMFWCIVSASKASKIKKG